MTPMRPWPRLYHTGGAAVPAIEAAFPGATKDGRVDRAELRKRVVNDPAALKKLDSVVHPLVGAERNDFLAHAVAQGADMVVMDVPLLFETGGHERMDAVVVVSAPAHIQRERGAGAARHVARTARQHPGQADARRRKACKSHFVVVTDKGLEHAFEQVKMIVAELRRRRETKT